jgi:hypothetical protein
MYLYGTRNLGITYHPGPGEEGGGTVEVEGQADADHGTTDERKRAMTGVVAKVGDYLVGWRSTLQKWIQFGTYGAELVAIIGDMKLVMGVKKTAVEVGLSDARPIRMFNDQAKVVKAINEGSIVGSEAVGYQSLPLHWLMQMTSEEDGVVRLRWKETGGMLADPLTKVMRSGVQARKLFQGMGLTEDEIGNVVKEMNEGFGESALLESEWDVLTVVERGGDGEGR